MRKRWNKEWLKNFLHYNAWVIALDVMAFGLSYLLTLYIRMYVNGVFQHGTFYLDYFWRFIPFYSVAAVFVFGAMRLYGGMWRYAGMHDLNRLISANAITAVLHVGISILVIALIPGHEKYSTRMPISYYIIGAVIQFLATTFIRFFNRFYQEERRRINRKKALPAMIVGTGETARMVRWQLEEDSNSGVDVICAFTYKDSEIGILVDGIPALGYVDQFADHIKRYQVKRVILADPFLPMSIREHIKNTSQETGVEIQDFSGFLRYDNSGLSFIARQLTDCAFNDQMPLFGAISGQYLQENSLLNGQLAA